MIELKHINKIYNGFNALNDISLTIKDGEICGIIGQSGAGKSTLVRCINMLEPPTSGDVIVNGRNMVTLSKRELRKERKKIGMIFQHFNLLSSRTVYENVAFPLELSNVPQGEQKERINDILELVGLADYRNKYPAQLSHMNIHPTKEHESDNILISLSFRGDVTNEPIIAQLIKKYNLNVSILYGSIDYIQDISFGRLLIMISGHLEDLTDALTHLNALPITSEVIGYVSRNN